MASNDISGGNKVVRHWMEFLLEDGQEVHCFVLDKRRQFAGWKHIPVIEQETIEETSQHKFDFVFFSNLSMIPMFMPFIGDARPVLLSMAYESFHYGKTYTEAMRDKEAFSKILRLPISIMAVSRAMQKLLKERVGADSFYVPQGIDSCFTPRQTIPFSDTPKRILMVGSYLLPWKGMADGFAAIDDLAKEMPLQLVLITQPTVNRSIFDKFNFPTEFHCQPELTRIPDIYASCHVCLCTSWHEGAGLPTMESMRLGVPAISTMNDGNMEFAKDGENILLVEKNNPRDAYDKLKLLLSNEMLRDSMCKQGQIAMRPYTWEYGFAQFKKAQMDIFRTVAPPIKVETEQMQQLLLDLEREGLYTPLNAYSEFVFIDKELQGLCEKLKRKEMPVSNAVAQLISIKNQLAPWVANEKSEYHDSFRAPFDLCRVLLSLSDDEKFADYAAIIASKYRAQRQ